MTATLPGAGACCCRDARSKVLLRRQALRILRGARELLNRRARELREQAEAAFKLVESADKAELAHGNAEAAAEGMEAEGSPGGANADAAAAQATAQGAAAGTLPGGQQPAGPQQAGAQPPAQPPAQQAGAQPPAQQPQQQAAGGTAGGQAGLAHAGRRGGPGSGQSVPSGGPESWRQRQQQRGDTGSVAAAAAAAADDDACSMDADEEGDDLLEAPPEEPTPPDPWQYGTQPGLHVLDTPEGVRQMCAILLPSAGDAAAPQAQQQGQQRAQQRYSCFGFHFEAVATGSAAGAAALLPRGPTAAQRRDHAAHDKQSAGGLGMDPPARAGRPWPRFLPLMSLLLRRQDPCPPVPVTPFLLSSCPPCAACRRGRSAGWGGRQLAQRPGLFRAAAPPP